MQKIKGFLAFIFTLGLGLALFVLFIKQVGIGNVLLELENIQFEWILLALVIFMAIFLVDAWRWKIILSGEGFLTKFRYVLVARFAWFAISFIVPIFYVVGEGFRAYILKKTSGIAITDSMRTIIIDKVVEVLMLFILLIAGGILLLLNFNTSFLTTTSWIMIIVGALGLVVFYWQVTSGKSIFRFLINFLKLNKIGYIKIREARICNAENEVYLFFGKHKWLFLKTLFMSAASVMLYVVLFKLILTSLGYDCSMVVAAVIRALIILTSMIPIPGELGISEGLLGGAFTVFGFKQTVGVSFSLIMRGFYLIWTAIGLISLPYFGISLVRDIFNKDVKV